MDSTGNGLEAARNRIRAALEQFADLRRLLGEVDGVIVSSLEMELRDALTLIEDHMDGGMVLRRPVEIPTTKEEKSRMDKETKRFNVHRLAEAIFVEAAGLSMDPKMSFIRAKEFFDFAEVWDREEAS